MANLPARAATLDLLVESLDGVDALAVVLARVTNGLAER